MLAMRITCAGTMVSVIFNVSIILEVGGEGVMLGIMLWL